MSLIDIKRFVQKNRPVLSGIGLVLAVALIFWVVSSPAIVGASSTTRQLPVYSVQRDDKAVALSFDAAWGNEDTQTLIDILNKYGINTTFFVVGDWVDKYPESAIPEKDAMKTFADAEQTLTGIYATFKSSSLFSGRLTLLPDIQADLVYAVEGNSNQFGNFWRWDVRLFE